MRSPSRRSQNIWPEAASLRRKAGRRFFAITLGRLPRLAGLPRRSTIETCDFFQGAEDAIVPPNQAEALVEALRRKGKPVGYFLFSGEQHGFRKAANIQRSLDAELQFYAIQVFKIGLTF
jgi:acetyl esterase/lipase